MLPAAARLRRREDFSTVLRSGRRLSRGPLVLHLLAPAAAAGPSPARVGFVIPGKVGNAVARNRLRRRLRALFRDRLGALPAGGAVVVRTMPGAAELDSAELGRLVDSALAGWRR